EQGLARASHGCALEGLECPRHGDAALDFGAELDQPQLYGRERGRDVEHVVVADVADPEDLALQLALPRRKRDAVPVAEERGELDRPAASQAAADAETIARPGGVISAFCAPDATTSIPHASVSSGTAPRLEIASTTLSAPASWTTGAKACRSETTPVEVSEC